MLIKGQDIANIIFGNTLSADGLPGKLFDYMLSNPPFGVEWKKIEAIIRKEFETQGFNGRFGPGLPRVSDGSLLFLLHLLSKMRPARDGGSRFGIVLNGSPLFTGGAGSGESEIRRYVLEDDLVDAIIGLPTDMFYNTGISTYVWIVSNRKPKARRGKVQFVDASSFWQKMRKSLGGKRKELSPAHIEDITRLFGEFREVTRDGVPISRIFKKTRASATAPSPSSAPSAMAPARSSSPPRAKAKASPCPTPPCPTPPCPTRLPPASFDSCRKESTVLTAWQLSSIRVASPERVFMTRWSPPANDAQPLSLKLNAIGFLSSARLPPSGYAGAFLRTIAFR
jgi:type I restriction enzyme M protein